LRDLEKAYGILKRYEDYGYSADQVIKGVKSIDCWFSDHTNHKTNWDAFVHKRVVYGSSEQQQQANPLRNDKKFVEICRYWILT
jgi:hypothetical protein